MEISQNSEEIIVLSGDKISCQDLRIIKNQVIGDPDIKLLYMKDNILENLNDMLQNFIPREKVEDKPSNSKSLENDSTIDTEQAQAVDSNIDEKSINQPIVQECSEKQNLDGSHKIENAKISFAIEILGILI